MYSSNLLGVERRVGGGGVRGGGGKEGGGGGDWMVIKGAMVINGSFYKPFSCLLSLTSFRSRYQSSRQ